MRHGVRTVKIGGQVAFMGWTIRVRPHGTSHVRLIFEAPDAAVPVDIQEPSVTMDGDMQPTPVAIPQGE